MSADSKSCIAFVNPSQPVVERWKHGERWSGVDELIIQLGSAHWYGMGALLNQQWPLEKLTFPRTRFITHDNGIHGLLGILEPFWANSDGLGIRVENHDLEVAFNTPCSPDPAWSGPDYKHLPNAERPPLSRGRETQATLALYGKNLTISFFEKRDVKEVVEAYWESLPNCATPPRAIFERVMWTTWAQFKNDISHEGILQTIDDARKHGFRPGVFGIDAKWQQEFGSFLFDTRKFPDPRRLIRELHERECEVTVWTVPFIMPEAESFAEGRDARSFCKTQSGEMYMGKWWEGESAFIDLTSDEALSWYEKKLDGVRAAYGVDGFKFDGGEGSFYSDPEMRTLAPFHPNHIARAYLEPLAKRFPWSDARAAWRCQDLPMLFRQWDKKTTWGFDNGLASCITGALTLNTLGYRFSFPDMIGGNEWAGDRADAELLIRWTQAVAPMPVIQFSVAPWREGDECAAVCARFASLHEELAPVHEALAKQHAPIVRPLWWLAPTDEQALQCDDEYLIGDDILVAPIIVPGARSRAIYFPPGTWRGYWNREATYEGGVWLDDFPAALEELPLFVRKS